MADETEVYAIEDARFDQDTLRYLVLWAEGDKTWGWSVSSDFLCPGAGI